MGNRTRETRARDALKGLHSEAGLDATLKVVFGTLENVGASKGDIAVHAIANAGGVMGTKDVATALSSHGVQVASTNVSRVTGGLEPFARVSGGQTPLYFGGEVRPHAERLRAYRENQEMRKRQEDALERGELVTHGHLFNEEDQP